MTDGFQLRAFFHLERLQPRFAAFMGTVIQGDMPVQGMHALFVEVAPGSEVFRLVNAAVKASRARPGAQVLEREFGLMEFHSFSLPAVRAAGQAVLAELGLTEHDRMALEIVSLQLIVRVDTYQAQLLNRIRRGATLVPGTTLFVIECTPAAYANLLANEAEKRANVDIINVSGLGRFGRLWLSGTEAEIVHAQTAIEAAVAALNVPIKSA